MDTSNFSLIYLDGSKHTYTYADRKIYYKIYESTVATEPQKNITLATELENVKFTYENNKLKTEITVNGVTYRNNFSI